MVNLRKCVLLRFVLSVKKVGQAWRLHVHPQDSSKAAYVNRKGQVKWNLQEIEVPTVEQCVREDALEVQDIRELGMGWAWFVNDFRAFPPAWQDMELASPSPDEPVTQIEADVPVEPLALHADTADLALALHSYERPLAVTPSGYPDVVPDWQDTHAMQIHANHSHLGKCFRTDLGVLTFQGLGKNAPARGQVVRRITRDLHSRCLIESLACDSFLQVPPATVRIYLIAILRAHIHVTLRLPSYTVSNHDFLVHRRRWWITLHHFFLRGGGFPPPFEKLVPQFAAC